MKLKDNYTADQVAQIIVTFARANNLDADDDFTAAAGPDYGYAAAYAIGHEVYAIAYGDNGSTKYALADDCDRLVDYLLGEVGDNASQLLQAAQILGLNIIPDAEPADEEYHEIMVLQWTHCLGRNDVVGYVFDFDVGRDRVFATVTEAQEWIARMEANLYTCGNDESGRSTYKIVAI